MPSPNHAKRRFVISRTAFLPAVLLLFGACGGEAGSGSETLAASTLTATSGQASLDECPNGGVTFDYGIDGNGDGTLGPDEVADTLVVCHGANGSDGISGTDSYADLTDKPSFAEVATSGDYSDLTNTPTFAGVATSGDYGDLINTPTLASVATSGDYGDLSNAPGLASVATSGDYNDLLNQPVETDPAFLASAAATVTGDAMLQWNTAYGWGDHGTVGYATTSSLSAVATSGDYSDLSNVPSELDPAFEASPAGGITSGMVSNWQEAHGWGDHASANYVVADSAATLDSLSTTGDVGVGVANPTTSLHVEGAVRLGDTAAACDSDHIGAIRWNATEGALQVCGDGISWETLYRVKPAQSGADAGLSCLDIKTDFPDATDGAFYIQPIGHPSAFQVYCDMTTDGGGWTLVGKVRAEKDDQDAGHLDGGDSDAWMNLNYLGSIASLDVEDALGPSYESVPFTDFMMQGLYNPRRRLGWRIAAPQTSLSSVFTQSTTVLASEVLFGSHATLDWRDGCLPGSGPDATGPTYYGFNIASDNSPSVTPLFNGATGGWCTSLAGWGRNGNETSYSGGGLGTFCQARGHQMGRHYWGFGDGCHSEGWANGTNFRAFNPHAFFVR